MPLSLWNHFLPWAIILVQLLNEPFFSSKPPPTAWGSIENLWLYTVSIDFSLLFWKNLLWLTFVTFSLLFNTLCPLIRCTLFQTSLSSFFFSIHCTFDTRCPPSFSPIQFPPSLPFHFPLVHIVVFVGVFLPGGYKRMKFVIQSMKLHFKVNSLESFTSQSFNYIC